MPIIGIGKLKAGNEWHMAVNDAIEHGDPISLG
jgi:hypothetical protein